MNEANYFKCKEFTEQSKGLIRRFEVGDYKNDVIKSSLERLGYIIFQSDTKEELERVLAFIK